MKLIGRLIGRLIGPVLLVLLPPMLASCQQQADAQAYAGDWEPGGEPADPATANARLEHNFPLADWSNADILYLDDQSAVAASRAICASNITHEPPPLDWPLLRDTQALVGCNSFNLYHGIGVPQDYEQARHCAMMERNAFGREWAISEIQSYSLLDGPGMLATIYANGAGVERNLGVAIHMACEAQDGSLAVDLRVNALARMQSEGWHGSDFSMCDHITSGSSAGTCTEGIARIADQARTTMLEQAAIDWSEAQVQTMRAAVAAFTSYAETASAMQCFGGTMATACQISASQRLQDGFAERLLAITVHRAASPLQIRDGDDGTAQAAIMTQAEWQSLLAERPPTHRPRYEAHRSDTIAARRLFEPVLIAYFALARPDLSAHQVRVLFRDI